MSDADNKELDILHTHCDALYDRTRTLWRDLEGQYPTWQCRFSILYGPPIFRPDLLILGSNPGFDPDCLYDGEILTWPRHNEYTTQDWPLAAKLRALFAEAGLGELLQRSVGTNKLFFKSKSLTRHETGLGWKDNPSGIRSKLEAYCAGELLELIRLIEPRFILVLGLSVFDSFADSISHVITSGKGRRLVAVGSAKGTKTIGIIHPTGARVSNEDLASVVAALASEFKGVAAMQTAAPRTTHTLREMGAIELVPKGGKMNIRQPNFAPTTVVRVASRPPSTFGYQPIHDFWRELSKLGEVTVEDFHRHMVSTGWRRPQGGALTFAVTRTDIACMCREGFATRVRG